MQLEGIAGRPAAGTEGAAKPARDGANESEVRGLEQQLDKESRQIEKDEKELYEAVTKKDNEKAQIIRARIQQRQVTVQTLTAQIETLRGKEGKKEEGGSGQSGEAHARHPYDRVELDERLLAQQSAAMARLAVAEEADGESVQSLDAE